MSHPFLLQLDGVVRRDAEHPGFVGKIGVVVRSSAGDQCWLGAFARHRASGELCSHLPADVGALVLLDEVAARSLSESGKLPGGAGARFAGDRTLMKRFLDRYLRRINLVGIRIDRGGSDGSARWTARDRRARASASQRRPR